MEVRMTHAIRFHTTGGPEVLRWEEVVVGEPGRGAARVRHTAIGLNFIDTYHRSGLYPLPLPSDLGMEAAGVVEKVGEGVTEVEVGQRVAYAGGPVGACSEVRLIPAHHLVPLPEGINDRLAAAMMLKGMTAQYLLRSTFRVGPEHTVLIHAAAGGVGLIACQWARHLGATVIGTVSTDAKAELAIAHGCHHVIVTGREGIVNRVKEITAGAGVHVVYDSVGRDTWDASLDCLRPRGFMVSFGNASGPVPPIPPLVLSSKGSLFLTRPTLGSYTATREELLACAGELFEVVTRGVVQVRIQQTYPLADAVSAHRDIEARRTTGSTLLLP
jgi:NADPH2:quinone reductase